MTLPTVSWRVPPDDLSLETNEVHVWRLPLDLPSEQVQGFERTLAGDELSRAGRFHFSLDRDRFIVAHGGLRDILSRYLDIEPSRLCFSQSDFGKPAVVNEFGEEMLHFSLAHSYQLALCAVSLNLEVGIDVEHMRVDVPGEEIAEQFFTPREVALLRELPSGLRKEVFYNCWTCKEAYAKVSGEGLSFPLDQLDVSAVSGELAALLSLQAGPQKLRFSLQMLAPGAGYVASLAVEGRLWNLKCWQWQAW